MAPASHLAVCSRLRLFVQQRLRPAATSSPSTPVTLLNNQGSPPLKLFAPITARRDTLASRAKIACRSQDELLVSVRVHANHPDGVPTIARQQYGASEEAKRKCVVKFIGSATGLNIASPTIPRYLLLYGDAFSAAVDNLSAQRRAWHEELRAKAVEDSTESAERAVAQMRWRRPVSGCGSSSQSRARPL